MWVAHRGVLRAGCYDVFKEGIPLDVQDFTLMATHFWKMRFHATRLEREKKSLIWHCIYVLEEM